MQNLHKKFRRKNQMTVTFIPKKMIEAANEKIVKEHGIQMAIKGGTIEGTNYHIVVGDLNVHHDLSDAELREIAEKAKKVWGEDARIYHMGVLIA